MRRRLALVLATMLLGAAPAQADAVPGDAPWSVLVVADYGSRYDECSGSLLEDGRVLTAAHCAGGPAGAYTVYAGWKGTTTGAGDGDFHADFEQARPVAALRSHPASTPGSVFADVAVLTPAEPFDTSGPSVRPIGLAPAAPAGTAARLDAYGPPDPGRLRTYDFTTRPKFACAGGGAIVLCGTSDPASACPGDSGGGLVTTGPALRLAGVEALASVPRDGAPCEAAFADLTAPALATWLGGSDAPPAAPLLDAVPEPLTAPLPDLAVHCGNGRWSAAPEVTYDVVDAVSGATLSAGAPWAPAEDDAGRTVRCLARATTAGGTGEALSDRLLAVPMPWGLYRVGRGLGVTVLRQYEDGTLGSFVIRDRSGTTLWRHTVVTGDEPEPPRFPVGAYDACVEVPAHAVYTAWRECLDYPVDGHARTLVTPAGTRRRGTGYVVRLRAADLAVGQMARTVWLTSRCRTCRRHVAGRGTVRLDRLTRTRSPRVAPGQALRLKLRIPEIASNGGRYGAGVTVLYVGRRRHTRGASRAASR